MTTDITELTPEVARESGSILFIVAARMARREFFTPLHALCEAGKRVVSTRALREAVERAEEHMVSQVPKIVDGHDRLTKKLKEAESRNAELVEALEKAQAKNALVAGGIEAAAKLHDRMAELESRTVTVKLLDCDLAAVQHMSGGSKDYCNGFVDGTQNAIRAMRSAGVDVREAE
ncbi:hypothetical protein [Raoultella sp. C349492]|uniref:hypothetical protein n=1 Tax=Raoultella sp. C349492 TaxID=2970253 RepID=UPI0035C71F30